jgi:hypothetical protein
MMDTTFSWIGLLTMCVMLRFLLAWREKAEKEEKGKKGNDA